MYGFLQSSQLIYSQQFAKKITLCIDLCLPMAIGMKIEDFRLERLTLTN